LWILQWCLIPTLVACLAYVVGHRAQLVSAIIH
jgi:hypothetical protein